MTVYIRTEANRTTATGHMTRCIAIAKEIKAMGGEAVFIVAEEGSMRMPDEAGFKCLCLNRTWDDFDGEIPVILELIDNNNIKCILVDSYFVTEKYMAAISEKTKTAYIDDLHERIWPVHAIINYAVYYDLFDYEKEYPSSDKLLGCEYAPLRPEYTNLDIKELSDVKDVLVVTGGSDEYHFIKSMAGMVEGCDELSGINFTFVCGVFNGDYDELVAHYEDHKSIHMLKSVPTLKPYMLSSDMLITAGGTTLYEAAACQIPCIAFRIADNQKYNVDGFASRGLVFDAGDVRYNFSYSALLEQVIELINSRKLRSDMRELQKKTLDGKGAWRLAKYLMDLG